MTTQEHLQKIKSKCEQLLAIAEKPLLARNQKCGCVVCICDSDTHCFGCGAKNCGNHALGQIPEPVYQPHCTGPAEAGWKATIAAIEWLVPEAKLSPLASAAIARQVLEAIIATWPEELL